MRSIYLQKDKEVFDVHALPAEEFAEALGLHGTPKMKFKAQHVNKNKSRDSIIDTKISASMKKKAEKLLNDAVSDSDDAQDVEKKQPKTRVEKMFKQKNLTVLSDHYKKLKEESDESDGDLLVVSRKDHDLSDNEVVEKLPKKKRSKQKRALEANGYGVKLVFDENGEARPAFELEKLEEFEKTDVKGRKSEFIQKQAEDLKEKDIEDKIKEKERRKSRKLEKKLKEKMKAQDEHQVICVDKTEEALVTLGPPTYDSFEADDAINTADSISAAESRESENSCSESENSDSSESEIQQNKRKSAASIPVLNKKQKLTDQLGKQELEALALKLLEE